MLDASVAYADLTRREADLALRTTRPSSGDLLVKKLGDVLGGVYGARRYAAEVGPLRRLEDARWITWGDDLGHLAPARLLAERVPAGRLVLRTSHMGAQVAAPAAGLGLLLCDRHTAASAGLVEIPLAPALRRALPPLTGGALWLAFHRALRDVPRVAAVREFLEETAREAGLAPAPTEPAPARAVRG